MTERNIGHGPASTGDVTVRGAAGASAAAGRTPPAAGARASVAVEEIIAAATALTWAARWDTARRLLEAAEVTGPDATATRRLVMAAASTAAHHDFRTTGARWAPAAIAAAEAVADPERRWNLDLLKLQHEYGCELTGPDGDVASGPEGRDPARIAALAERAEALVRTGPDTASAGWAAFYRGLIADNLAGDRDDAPRWFVQALDAAGRAGDDYLAGEALRHLGDHDEEAGDLRQARARWERSTELWARIGNVSGVLAQQLLLAQLAMREERFAAGTAIATEVRRWAGALGLVMYQKSADALLASHRKQSRA